MPEENQNGPRANEPVDQSGPQRDLGQQKPAADAKADTRMVTYMPGPQDLDETTVAGHVFKAYEPRKLPAGFAYLIDKLHSNPWFTAGEVDADRKAKWKKSRDARAAAAKNAADLAAAEKEAAR